MNKDPELVRYEEVADGAAKSALNIPTTSPLQPGEVGQLQCGPNAACAEEFVLDGIVYSLSCRAVRVDAVLAEQLGFGRAFHFDVEVRGVEGFSTDQVVAISVPGGQCSENDPDEIHTPWSLAFATGIDPALAPTATCQVGALSPKQAEADRCIETAPDTAVDVPIDALAIVTGFVDALTDGGTLGAAAEMWSGYPFFDVDVGEGDPDEHKMKHLADFVEGNAWLLDNELDLQVLDAWGYAGYEPMKVVSITDVDRRWTVAVLVGGDGLIHRIQHPSDSMIPTEVTSNKVVIPGGPSEGGVVAYLNGDVLPSGLVEVPHESDATVVEIPELVRGEPRVLVISMATPELPTALSVIVPAE